MNVPRFLGAWVPRFCSAVLWVPRSGFLGSALLLLALVPVAVQSTTPPATGSLSGAVTDPEGWALPGVTVTADNGTVKRSEVTNSDGRFAFAGLPVGRYRVEAVLEGLGRAVQDLVPVRSTVIVHITMRMTLTGVTTTDYFQDVNAGKEKEFTLKPGLSLPWPGTRLGHSREFDNDIYGLKCSAVVTTGGRVLQWIHRLHVTSGRAFVEPCEELELNRPDSTWPRPAAFADWVFEATMGGDDEYPQMALRRLALPGWGYQSNGAFCGRSVAYWSLERDAGTQSVALHARIADLFTHAVVARERLGPARLETDNPGAFETPVWDDTCRVATMSGQEYGLKIARLTVTR